MKRILLAVFLAAITFIPAFAQQFQTGTGAVNLGVGFGTALNSLGTGRPAISLSYERGLWDAGPGVISLGGYVGNTGFTYKAQDYTQKWNYTVVGARGAYHHNGFTSVPKLDPYAGLMLGYNIVKYSATGDYTGANNYGSGVGYSLFVGGRWYFSENIAAFAELGYGISVANIGVAFKL